MLTTIGYISDYEYQVWARIAFVELEREYKFTKRIKANTQSLYNLYDDHNNSNYTKSFAVGMYFEWHYEKKN